MRRKQTLLALFTVVLILGSTVPAGAVVAGAPVASHGGGSNGCGFPYTSTDGTGTEVTIESEPKRVVVLGPSATQITWEIGASEKVVGIDSLSTYFEGASNISVVAQGVRGVDYEAAISQNPDLIVIAGGIYEGKASEFRNYDVPVYKMPDAKNLSDIYSKVRTMGHLYGNCGAAADTVSWMQQRVRIVREATDDVSTPTLFHDLGGARQSNARYSSGPNSYIGQIIELAGASNIVTAENFTGSYPKVSAEYILAQNPQWILTTYNPAYGNASAARKAVRQSEVLSQTAAVKQDQIIVVNANNLNQPAPRVVYALENITKRLHPDAYAAAKTQAQQTATGTATETATRTATQTATATEQNGGGGVPGFGPTAALAGAALAGAAMLGRRRYQ